MVSSLELAISKIQILSEINKMLDKVNPVYISWAGRRLVSVKGFSGSVDINVIVAKFLKLAPGKVQGVNNLSQRIQFYDLWGELEKICRDETHLKTTKIYKYIVPFKEDCYEQCRCGVKVLPKNYIIYATKEGEDDGHPKFPSKNDWCFSFHPNEFKEIFPGQDPLYKVHGIDGETYVASRFQVNQKVLK